MVACALWRSEPRRVTKCLDRRPYMSCRRMQGRSQGTTLSVSDLHNARATILNPFYIMEYEMIKKNKTKYDVNRSGHSRHKSHPQSVQCARPSHCLRQQWLHSPIQHHDVPIATQRTLLWAHVNGTEIVWKSTDQRSNLSLFLYVQGLIHGCLIVFIWWVIRWNCVSKMWCISLPCILHNDL